MKGIGGCLLVFLGLFGLFLSIAMSFTYYLLPFAFFFFIGSLILISYALGPSGEKDKPSDLTYNKEVRQKKNEEGK